MRIPNKLDISPTDGLDLDEREALKNFLGKSREEAEKLFFHPANHIYFEDLFWMGGYAFTYYARTPGAYFLSEDSRYDEMGVSWYLSAIEIKLKTNQENLINTVWPCRADLLEILYYIRDNHDKFHDEKCDIYGDNILRVRKLIPVLKSADPQEFLLNSNKFAKDNPLF